jgi:hypothetical protein
MNGFQTVKVIYAVHKMSPNRYKKRRGIRNDKSHCIDCPFIYDKNAKNTILHVFSGYERIARRDREIIKMR